LDLLFEKRISARKFASTEVDVFAESLEDDVLQKYQDQVVVSHSEKGVWS
jgi:MFS transporter, SP family, general alpha glucoside:H+ symporter